MDHHNKIEKYNNDPWPSQVNCPKDSIDYYFDKEQRVVYIFEVKYVKAADKCVESKSYWVRLPSGRMILISKEIWEKKTGKVVKPNNN